VTESERLQRIDAIIRTLEGNLGKGSIMRSDSIPERVDVIPTGIIGIDRALGVGGMPRGRISEIYGPESSGKSTLALHVLAQVQVLECVGAYVDAEHAFDPEYASTIGVSVDDLLISQPDSGEQALEIVEALVRTGDVACVVIDSVASLVPRAELEGEMGQSFVGLQARLMSQAMRKLTAVTSKSNCALIFLNQLREKVGIMFGNPETTPGGRALKFYSSIRMDMRRGQAIDKDQSQTGFTCKIKVVKNKLAPPYKTVEVPLIYGKGFDATSSLVTEALGAGLIQKQGAWYMYNGQKFHGMPVLVDHFVKNLELKNSLENEIRQPAVHSQVH
jgi:recombination protein RecA